MVKITINGQAVEASEGTTVLQAARSAGIQIPTLCDHPALEPYGGCRLCMVEIQGWRAPAASCTLPVAPGMIIQTDTPKLRASRKFVLDMLFSERNHFCPFCQESGGDCELQNNAYGQGMTQWDFQPNWKKFEVDASHKHYVMDHNRCILCRRCIRACSELTANFTLSAAERGSSTMVVADYGLPLGSSSCVSCGMCVQVCPTGALIDRYAAYKGHSKDWTATQSTCNGCSTGCSTVVWSRDNQLVKIEGDWNGAVNGGMMCEIGRFKPVSDRRTRLSQPLVRKDGKLQPSTWEEAIHEVSTRLAKLAGQNGHGVAALASTRLPAEDLALFRRLFADGLGSGMVTSIEEGVPTGAAYALAETLGHPFESKMDDIKQADLVLAIGVDLIDNHQVLGFFLKRLLPAETPLFVVDPGENEMKHMANLVFEPAAGQDLQLIDALRRGLSGETLAAGEVGLLCQALAEAQRPAIVYGKGISRQNSETLRQLNALCNDLRQMGKRPALLGVKGESNSLAAAQYGLDKTFSVEGRQMAYLAIGDDFPSRRLLERAAQAPFKVVQATYASALTEMADVVLPVSGWAEHGGHFLNMDGRLQKSEAVLNAPAGVRSHRQVLTELAGCLNIDPTCDWKAALSERVSPVALDLDVD
ncbi:MAG: molybdopterin-dependent oxidoreductase [Chloroflexota bacterium]